MEKNQLKVYEAPAVEIVELEAKIVLLAGSGDDYTEDSDDRY